MYTYVLSRVETVSASSFLPDYLVGILSLISVDVLYNRVIADTVEDRILKMQERKVLHLSGALENIFLFVTSSKHSPTTVWAKAPERRLAVSIFCLVFISSMKLISNPLRIVGKGAWEKN